MTPMESLSHADIFFVITGVAVIIFASACVVFVVYAIMITRDIRYIVKMVRGHADRIGDDVERFRSMIAAKEWGFRDLLGLFKRSPRTSSRRKVGSTNKDSSSQ